MIIGPQFYRPLHVDRVAEMRKCGLNPDRPTGLVLFGGYGSRVMRSLAEELTDIQLILICGHNAKLAAQLRGMRARAPRHIVDFTTEIPYYMALSDFFLGKPGPGCISEAIHQGLPVIVVRNAYTMPQERYNTEWVLEQRVGVVLKSFKAVGRGAAEMTERLDEFRENIQLLRNQALFEIPEILDGMLESSSSIQRAPKYSAGAPRP